MKLFFLFILLLFSSQLTKAQPSVDTLKPFAIDSNIIQDKRVNELVLKHVLVNQTKKGKIKGYRVQIHFGSEKAKALDIKAKYTSMYRNSDAYLDYQQPYFKIRAGDFRTKLEAYKLLQDILGDFPGAFIVSDDVELTNL